MYFYQFKKWLKRYCMTQLVINDVSVSLSFLCARSVLRFLYFYMFVLFISSLPLFDKPSANLNQFEKTESAHLAEEYRVKWKAGWRPCLEWLRSSLFWRCAFVCSLAGGEDSSDRFYDDLSSLGMNKPSGIIQHQNHPQFSSPQDCMFTEWSGWSPCSATCGKAWAEKTRMIKVYPTFNLSFNSTSVLPTTHSPKTRTGDR